MSFVESSLKFSSDSDRFFLSSLPFTTPLFNRRRSVQHRVDKAVGVQRHRAHSQCLAAAHLSQSADDSAKVHLPLRKDVLQYRSDEQLRAPRISARHHVSDLVRQRLQCVEDMQVQ